MLLCSHHRRPFTLSLGRAKGMDPKQQCNARIVDTYMRLASWKVGWLVWILK